MDLLCSVILSKTLRAKSSETIGIEKLKALGVLRWEWCGAPMAEHPRVVPGVLLQAGVCPTPWLSGGLGLGRTFCSTGVIEIFVFMGKEKRDSEGSQGSAEIKVTSIPITLLCFFFL